MSVLKLLNVESAYGPIRAIRGVSLAVEKGRIGTVLGANGAGKSTILKTISGIIDPRKGSVEFAGADITAMDPAEIVRRGERPRLGSSRRIICGAAISAREMLSICCWPPESSPASWCERSRRIGK